MGEIAAKFCDYIILTGEDPRNEDVNKISDEIASGIKKEGGIQNQTYWLVSDRVGHQKFSKRIRYSGNIRQRAREEYQYWWQRVPME